MRITPLDIQQKQFPVRWFRGFDVGEVYSFLEIVREEMEDLLRENAGMKEKLRIAETQISQYKAMEDTLKDTILTTQHIAEEFRVNARKEADLLVTQARIDAETIIKGVQDKVTRMNEDIVDLKGIRRHFKEELGRLIESVRSGLDYDDVREGENLRRE